MRVVELFAGIGGFRLGLERVGHTVVWANEWDRFAADIYDKNFGGQIDRRDITLVEASDIPAHDILCGGFPCQSFSVAGKRRGFDETRGTLFFDIIRIAKHHQTPFLFLENVKGLLNHDGGQTFEVILRTLDESGYDAQWQVLNSKNFGVPQNRERVIIIANLRNRPRRQVFPITSTEPENIEPVSDVEPGTKAIATRHLDRNGSLISDIAPTVQATETPHIINLVPGVSQDNRIYAVDGIAPTFNPAAAVGGANVPKIAKTIRVGGGGPPFGSKQNWDTYDIDGRIRKLTPVECERLQGFPDNWTKLGVNTLGVEYAVSNTQRYKAMGNAVTTNVVEAVAWRLL